jgi:hypothetical protein
MDKETAWNIFYETGNLDAYLLYKESNSKKEEKSYNTTLLNEKELIAK